jgi:hypothetical protein
MGMTTATEARDAGMAEAENAADPRLILAIDAKIAELNASGMPWSANDARSSFPVVSSGLVGARVHAAALRKPVEMVRVGMTRSTLVSTKRAWIAVWQGVTS